MKNLKVPEEIKEEPLPKYEPPQVIAYTDEEILEEMGPTQAMTGIIDP